MFSTHSPIGVMDAGLGGYTVVKELQKLLPHEEILYLGEGVYQPYGNRGEAEILFLTRQCLDFLQSRGVKIVAVPTLWNGKPDGRWTSCRWLSAAFFPTTHPRMRALRSGSAGSMNASAAGSSWR